MGEINEEKVDIKNASLTAEPIPQEKEHLGKYGNLVRIDAWILVNQDRKLEELSKLTGKSKGAVLRDLIALGIGRLENEGVI